MDYSFNTDIAALCGVEEAVIVHNLYYWILKNSAKERHIYDGKVWTYNTIKAFNKLFSFWTERKIRTLLLSLKKQGAIIIGNYNKTAMDRTQWYTLSDEIMAIYENDKCIYPKREMGNSDGEDNSSYLDEFYEQLEAFLVKIHEKIDFLAQETTTQEDTDHLDKDIQEKDGILDKNANNLAVKTPETELNNVENPPIYINSQMHLPKSVNAITKNGKCNYTNSQKHVTDLSNASNINTNTKLTNKSINQSKTNNIINLNACITPLSPQSSKMADRLTDNWHENAQITPIISEKAQWYVNWLNDNITQSIDILGAANIGSRFITIVEEISHKQSIMINSYPVAAELILESFVNFFQDEKLRALIDAYEVIDDKVAAGSVKNKLNYTISTLYNAARL